MDSDSFIIQNSPLAGVNDELRSKVDRAGVIIEDLNQILKRMDEATQNSGHELWVGYQTKWNSDYMDMVMKLEGGHNASVDAHEWYKHGDRQSVRIML